MAEIDERVAPVGDEIHLPEPTILPFILAVAMMVAIVGITVNIIMVIAGAIVAVVCLVKWIGTARREFNELPLDH